MRSEIGGAFAKDEVRQVGRTLAEISPNHLVRYFHVASMVGLGTRVVDVGCGCGYGTYILWLAAQEVVGIDVSLEAIDWAKEFYKGPVYIQANADKLKVEGDVAVVFELIEHMADPISMLKRIETKVIFASVPNEDEYPFKAEDFAKDEYPHLRHYKPQEFESLLEEAGFRVASRYCQRDKIRSGVLPGTNGKFLIYTGIRD